MFQWQSEQNHPEGHQLHWDHALLLTGLDLKVLTGSEGKFPKYSPKIVGLSPVSGMCNPATSCTVSEGNHFESVFVIAHEIGHSLGKKNSVFLLLTVSKNQFRSYKSEFLINKSKLCLFGFSNCY